MMWALLLAILQVGVFSPGAFVPQSVAAATPMLIQGPFSTPNDVQTQSPINITTNAAALIKCFPKATQSGDTIIVLAISESTTANQTVTDDGSTSNTYAIPSGATESAGSHVISLYTATVSHTSHCVSLNWTNASTATDNQMVIWEYANLGTVDKTCAGTVTTGTTLTCAAMTTTVNGDFIISAHNVVTYSSTPSGFARTFTAQASWALNLAHDLDWMGVQTITQSTAGSITPALTVSAAVTRANSVGIAFEVTSAGGSVPSGPYLLSMQNQNTGSSGWGFSTTSSSTTQTMQVPTKGNDPWLLVGAIDSISVSSVTDSNSNTWACLTRVDSTGDGFFIQWCHITSATPTLGSTLTVTVHFSGSPASDIPLFAYFDVAQSGGYDSSATCGAGSTPCAINTTCSSTTSCGGATITPSVYPSLVLSYQNQDFDTICAVNVGQFMAGVEGNTPLASYCGSGTNPSNYYYAGPGLEQDAGIVADNLASGSAAITWSVANTQNTNVGPSFSSTVAIKHQ